jgi:hypothetical protein
MFKKLTLVLLVFVTLTFASSVVAATGCKKFNFVGSYTRPQPNVDIFGDGVFIHDWVYQLNLHGDGTASQFWTGGPDFMMNGGFGAQWIGSWTCRDDGKLVVTMIVADYNPVAAGTTPNVAVPDIGLVFHLRSTWLFTVDSASSITRVQARNRVYQSNQDPTDPTGGSLRPINTDTVTYTRLVASDSDLLLP